MTRRKVKLAFISNDAARKTTYKKRKNGLLKKVDELTTLCGVDACAIVYSPYDPKPEIWATPQGVQNVLSKFKAMPELVKSKKMMNQETFMNERILKANEQVKKQMKDNREKEMTLVMFQCLNAGEIVHNNISINDLNYLDWLIDQNLKNIDKKLKIEDNDNSQSQIMTTQSQVQVQMAPPPPPPPSTPWMDEMAMMMGQGGMTLYNDDIVRKNICMDLMENHNGEKTIPFDHSHDVNPQSCFWSNLGP